MKKLWCVVLAAGLYGCASAVGSGYGQGGQDASGRSYAEARLDNQITALVSAALVQDKSVPGMDINVSTFNGVVTLEGVVNNSDIAERAASLASRVEGVTEVVNNLRILRP